jgi:hypothetical protein
MISDCFYQLKNILYHFVFILVTMVIFILSCQKQADLPTISFDELKNDQEIKIKEWQIVGPFLTDTSDAQKRAAAFNRDDLVNFGTTEEAINAELFASLGKESASINLPVYFVNKKIQAASSEVNLAEEFKYNTQAPIGNAYAACEIQCSEDKELVLCVGSDDGIKIFLNNRLLFAHEVRRGIFAYSDFVKTRLKKGKNFLLVKINNYEGRWDFILNIGSLSYAWDKYKEWGLSDFLEKSMVTINDNLAIKLNLYESSDSVKFQILDFKKNILINRNVIFRGSWKEDLNDLNGGLYYVKIICATDTFEQQILYGDIKEQLVEFKKRFKQIRNIDQKTEINLDALFIRYEHLLKPENRWNERIWQKKIIYLAHELEIILNDLEHNKSEYIDIPGTHLRGFRSLIDGQVQHYLVSIPKQYAKSRLPIPVVINIPYDLISDLPYIKNKIVANIIQIERDARMADKYGYGVIYTSTRGNAYGAPIWEKAILEVLAAVKEDYHIDDDRVYLMGGCNGGTGCLILASRFPSRFAAIGINTPIVDSFESRIYVENLINIPIRIIHSTEDEIIPFAGSERFVQYAINLGIDVQFDILHDCAHHLYPDKAAEGIFKFFKNKTRVKKTNKIIFSTTQIKYNNPYWIRIRKMISTKKASIKATIENENKINVSTDNICQYELLLDDLDYMKNKPFQVITNGKVSYQSIPASNKIIINVEGEGYACSGNLEKNASIEGPVAYAFAGPFIVIGGTGGSAEEKKLLAEEMLKFKKLWQTKYFGDFRYKNDFEVTSSDIKNCHPILIGDQYTNSFIKRIIKQIPLTITSERITVGEKVFEGDKLNLHMVYPNPLNKHKYVVLITSNNLQYLSFGDFDLSTSGWYDYAIWNVQNHKFILQDAGYFNNCWQVE